MTADEGKGLDLALEIYVSGNRRKDHEANVARYAKLGIGEYFIFDRGRLRLSGYRLPVGGGRYEPILPQHGHYESRALGLELALEEEKLRFYCGDAPVPEAEELIGKLENAGMVFEGIDYAHALHSPYWWLKCAVGVENSEHVLPKTYHRLLVWDIMKRPWLTRTAERLLNPVIGKSMVLYLRKPEAS